ncbi:MAG: SocA family protein [Prevotellaceae bacterium]|jgi:uncharacterized phage-associated protein|nr:SocA family protein [Prevotellaceae bacterium]
MLTPIFNLEKSLNAILYIAHKLQRKDFHKIFKVLYFADREHLSKYGRPITGDTYIKMINGPVPSKIYDIFKAVKGDSFFSDEATEYKKLFNIVNDYIIEPLQLANLDFLSKTDIEEIDNSLLIYGNLPFGEITKLSHDYAWASAIDDCPIDMANILREVGQSEDYIEYINDFYITQKSICN